MWFGMLVGLGLVMKINLCTEFGSTRIIKQMDKLGCNDGGTDFSGLSYIIADSSIFRVICKGSFTRTPTWMGCIRDLTSQPTFTDRCTNSIQPIMWQDSHPNNRSQTWYCTLWSSCFCNVFNDIVTTNDQWVKAFYFIRLSLASPELLNKIHDHGQSLQHAMLSLPAIHLTAFS